mmetsp:Transcript_20953/g.46769  ORF Transcript_20953/g.46769 Transcript_20953/m.46769 type:complete len:214 (+) Transcript_20953:132-773(+)
MTMRSISVKLLLWSAALLTFLLPSPVHALASNGHLVPEASSNEGESYSAGLLRRLSFEQKDDAASGTAGTLSLKARMLDNCRSVVQTYFTDCPYAGMTWDCSHAASAGCRNDETEASRTNIRCETAITSTKCSDEITCCPGGGGGVGIATAQGVGPSSLTGPAQIAIYSVVFTATAFLLLFAIVKTVAIVDSKNEGGDRADEASEVEENDDNA